MWDMAIPVLIPLAFLLEYSIVASTIGLESLVCGNDIIGFSNFDDQKNLYMNGKLVDSDVFCKILRFHLVNGCLHHTFSGIDFCQLTSDVGHLRLKHSRKVLENSGSDGPDNDKPDEKDSSSFSTAQSVGVAAGGALCLCCIFICPCFYKKRKPTSEIALNQGVSREIVYPHEVPYTPEKVPPSPLRVPPSPLRFSASPQLNRLRSVHLSMSQAVKATRNFSPSCQIGEGGFGTVYKAYLESGQAVAIKRAKKEEFDNMVTEFRSEVELLAKIDHKNLVKLLGYVEEGNERLIITEYVPNGTLREHLDGLHGRILDFNQRLEISIDVAHGLTYLHIYSDKQIIHRDVKSSNILLSATMRAKVADFGFARIGSTDADHSHVSTKVKGTLGYLDPEYYKTLQLNAKSDVYSFGILLLEILTGRRPVELKRPQEERVTLKWVFSRYRDGAVRSLMDPLMEEKVPADVLNKMFALALECAAPIRASRPDMKTVGERLWGIRKDYMNSPSNSQNLEMSELT